MEFGRRLGVRWSVRGGGAAFRRRADELQARAVYGTWGTEGAVCPQSVDTRRVRERRIHCRGAVLTFLRVVYRFTPSAPRTKSPRL